MRRDGGGGRGALHRWRRIGPPLPVRINDEVPAVGEGMGRGGSAPPALLLGLPWAGTRCRSAPLPPPLPSALPQSPLLWQPQSRRRPLPPSRLCVWRSWGTMGGDFLGPGGVEKIPHLTSVWVSACLRPQFPPGIQGPLWGNGSQLPLGGRQDLGWGQAASQEKKIRPWTTLPEPWLTLEALEVDFVGLCAKLGPLGGWEISDQ